MCRSWWQSGLRRGSAADLLLRLRVRIPPGAWMSVPCKCCVLSGMSLRRVDPLPPRNPTNCVWSRNLKNESGLARVGLYIYMCVCRYIHAPVCVCVCVCVWKPLIVFTRMYLCKYAYRSHVCTYACMLTYVYVCMYAWTTARIFRNEREWRVRGTLVHAIR